MESSWHGEASQLKLRQYVIEAMRKKDAELRVAKEAHAKAKADLTEVSNRKTGWRFWYATKILDLKSDAEMEVIWKQMKVGVIQGEIQTIKRLLFLISMVPTYIELNEHQLKLLHETLT